MLCLGGFEPHSRWVPLFLVMGESWPRSLVQTSLRYRPPIQTSRSVEKSKIFSWTLLHYKQVQNFPATFPVLLYKSVLLEGCAAVHLHKMFFRLPLTLPLGTPLHFSLPRVISVEIRCYAEISAPFLPMTIFHFPRLPINPPGTITRLKPQVIRSFLQGVLWLAI